MVREQPARGSDLLARSTRVHFVGIGGVGMSALAELLLRGGNPVTGSDMKASPVVERLRSLGAKISVGHSAEAVVGAGLVVATAAARPDNPELVEAARRGIPVVKRAELLGWLMTGSYGLAVAGTHGKTTTTAMLGFLLHRAGLDPTVLVGGEPLDFESNGLLGKGPHLVAEADEFDRSFLQLWPRVSIITSVEADHLDCYADLDDIARTFREFACRVPADGLLVTCADDPVLAAMEVPVPRQTYGLAAGARWRVVHCNPVPPSGTSFAFTDSEGLLHMCMLRLAGRHYALDALAAIAAANHVGVHPGRSARLLEEFHGTRRRFELLGAAAGVVVIDDYAHHPTAVAATLGAARERHRGRIWCVFQPHTVNRTERLLAEFARAFGDADRALVLPIYHPSGREEAATVTGRDLVAAMEHPGARAVESLAEAVALLEAEVVPGDLVITMGAGDVDRVGGDLLERLRTENSEPADPFAHLAAALGPEAKRDEPMGRHTSFRVGGPAALLVRARGPEDLARLVPLVAAGGVPWRVLGGGTNVLVADAGVRECIVESRCDRWELRIVEERLGPDWDPVVVVEVPSGCPMATVARRSVEQGLAGLEWAAGLPGTIGGAVANNAGAHGGDVAGLLESALAVDARGRVLTLLPADLGYEYRRSNLKGRPQPDLVVLSARFRLRRGSREGLQNRAAAFEASRRQRQPPGLSAGSMFKNPPGDYAGRLIDAAGLKGTAHGGARVSQLHGNFFLNTGDAAAGDFHGLMRAVQQVVWQRFGVWLEPEVELIGEWTGEEREALARPPV